MRVYSGVVFLSLLATNIPDHARICVWELLEWSSDYQP